MTVACSTVLGLASGTSELDGGSWDVDNNIWIVGNDNDVVVFDAVRTAAPIIKAEAERNVIAVICGRSEPVGQIAVTRGMWESQ